MYQMVFRFSKELHEKLSREAKKRGQTLTGLMRQILFDWAEDRDERA